MGEKYKEDLNLQLSGFAIHGKSNSIEELIKLGADIHFNEEEALHNAAFFNNIEAVKCLVDNGADIYIKGSNLLIKAVRDENLILLEALACKGLNFNKVNVDSLMKSASSKDNIELVKFLIENGITNGEKEKLDLFLELICKGSGSVEVAKYLLAQGANFYDKSSKTIYSSLAIAIAYNNVELASYILDLTENSKKPNYKEFALGQAVRRNMFELVKKMIEKGARVSAAGNLIDDAVKMDLYEMAKYLFDHGAILDVGKTGYFFDSVINNDLTVVQFFVFNCKVDINTVLKYVVDNNGDVNKWAKEYKSLQDLNKKLNNDLVNKKDIDKKMKI